MRVDLAAFARPEIVVLAAALTVAAVLGKQACGLGALGGDLDWRSIGIGMVPRGEVGLIFANTAHARRGERVVDAATYLRS
jgi:Kef-type K+ transport system membrane component KefB